MEINELREQIDRIDRELVRLYCERMETAKAIGRYKRENRLPVLDREREQKVLDRAAALAGEENEDGVRALFTLLMDQSRQRQREGAPSDTK